MTCEASKRSHTQGRTVIELLRAFSDAGAAERWLDDQRRNDGRFRVHEVMASKGMPVEHEGVKHTAGEHVVGMAHANELIAFWALLELGCHGTLHHVSEIHLNRCDRDFGGRHNVRGLDYAQMSVLTQGMVGKC